MYDEIRSQLWEYKKHLHELGKKWERSLPIVAAGFYARILEDGTPKAPLGIRDELKFLDAEIDMWMRFSKDA